MIKGLGDMAGGMLGDAVSNLAGEAAGPMIEQLLELVQSALTARDGGTELSNAQTGALGKIAEAFGVGSPEEVVAMGAEKLGEMGLPDNLSDILSALQSLKG